MREFQFLQFWESTSSMSPPSSPKTALAQKITEIALVAIPIPETLPTAETVPIPAAAPPESAPVPAVAPQTVPSNPISAHSPSRNWSS